VRDRIFRIRAQAYENTTGDYAFCAIEDRGKHVTT